MATALTVITDAFGRIGVVPIGSDPTAEESADGLSRLNDMIQGWAARDVHTGMAVLALTDTVALEDKHIGGLKDMLAEYVAADYGATPSEKVKNGAMLAWQLIRAEFRPLDKLRCDPGLLSMPSQRRGVW